MQTRSSSKLARDQTSNPTSSTNPTAKGRIRRSSKQKVENSHFEENLTPVAKMTDNRTMAEMLRAPTEGGSLPKFDESFHEAWERYNDLLRACPHHGFTELHQLDTFYNALNPADQDSLNAAAGGNLLEKSPQDASEIAKLTHAVNQQTSAVTTAMTAMLKQLQSNPPLAQVKAVEEICVTCGGAHPYHQCLTAGGNTFPEFRDNIQGYVSAAAGNFNQGNPCYRPQGVANQMRPPGFAQLNVQNNQNRFGQPQGFNRTNFNQEQPYQPTAQSNQNFHLNELEKIKRINNVSLKAMQNQIDMVKNELRNEMKTSIQTSLSNQTNEIKNMMASLLQMNTASSLGSGSLPSNTVANPKGELKAITTRSGLVTDGPTVPTPPKSVNLEEDECVEETYTDLDLAEYTIKVPPPLVQTPKPQIQRHFVLHTRDSPPPNIPYPSRMLKQKQQEKDDIQIQKFWNMFKQLHLNITLAEALVLMDVLFLSEELPDIDSFNDIHPHFDDDPLSGSTTYSANSLLEEFADELAFITYPLDYDDNRMCDIESDIREIDFLLSQGEDSDFKDSIDQSDLTNHDDLFVDPTLEMFTDEQPPDYSFLSRFDVYPDDFLEIESDADTFDYDSFDSKGEKIKEAELLIDQLDLPCDILSEYILLILRIFPGMMFCPHLKTRTRLKKTKKGQNRNKNGKCGEAGKSQKQLQDIVSRNVLTFRIPSSFVIVVVVMVAVVGSWSGPACTTLSNSRHHHLISINFSSSPSSPTHHHRYPPHLHVAITTTDVTSRCHPPPPRCLHHHATTTTTYSPIATTTPSSPPPSPATD
uniref:Reverse transcriptase domain-containing protein n=1 Tax=Tanacetum cinerariifolium TaxID=118510 RepID=A0A6L2K9U5_TANCI|nr:hypothetical protein [Tanacetum cinerariifolium]